MGAFVLVCALEIVAAVLLWNGHGAGAWLGAALLLPGLVSWVGFSLPIPPVVAAIRSVLVLMSWRSLGP